MVAEGCQAVNCQLSTDVNAETLAPRAESRKLKAVQAAVPSEGQSRLGSISFWPESTPVLMAHPLN